MLFFAGTTSTSNVVELSRQFLGCHLRLVANEQVVVHGVRDVVNVELQVRPLRHVDKAHARPGGAAVQRVGPGHQRHPLKERKTSSAQHGADSEVGEKKR